MLRVYAICVSITLLLSAGAFALGNMPKTEIGQTQNFQINGSLPISIIGVHGSTSVGHITYVEQDQSLMKLNNRALTQTETSLLTQNTNALNKCGSINFLQQGSAVGTQEQLLSKTGWKNTTTMGQSLDVGLQQYAVKYGGGNAEGVQSSFSEQNQSVTGAGSLMNSSQSVGAIQTTNISGTAWSGSEVANTIKVIAEQTQTSN
jgi:hypothetical protein